MSTSSPAAWLKRRPFRLTEVESFASDRWLTGKPFATQMLNAYNLLVPGGERFVIRTCNHYKDRTSPALREELEGLFFQEGSHAREHTRLLKSMQPMGLGADGFRKFVEWFSYGFLEPLSPRIWRLATAVGIEHHNAAIATYFLNQDLLSGADDGELRRLFLWHFCEEIEHKETVFKLLQERKASWFTRMLGLFVSLTTFILFLYVGAFVYGVKTRAWRERRFWSDCAAELFGRRGLLRLLLKESGRFMKPGFFPSASESKELLTSALAELDRLGIERPRLEHLTAA